MKWKKVWIEPRKRKKSVTYLLKWYGDDGKAKSENVGSDKKNAEQRRRKKELEVNSTDYFEMPEILLESFIAEYLEYIKGKLADSSVNLSERAFRDFSRIVTPQHLAKITAKDVTRFQTVRLKEGVSTSTVNLQYRHLKAAFNLAIQLKYIGNNPFVGIRPLPEVKRNYRILPPEEVHKVILASKEEGLAWELFIRLILETAARRGAILNLKFEDFNLERGLVVFTARDGWTPKDREESMHKISSYSCELVRQMKATTPFMFLFTTRVGTVLKTTQKPLKRIIERSGVKEFTLHDLRRTVISTLAAQGINQVVNKEIAGHSSIVTTEKHYTVVNQETCFKAVSGLPWWNNVG